MPYNDGGRDWRILFWFVSFEKIGLLILFFFVLVGNCCFIWIFIVNGFHYLIKMLL